MKLYPSYLILQQQVVSITTIDELKELCHQLKLKVEVKFFFSTFSNLVWDLSNELIKGTFNAHIFTTVSDSDDSNTRTLASSPFPLHFETDDPQPLKQFESEIIRAIRESLLS